MVMMMVVVMARWRPQFVFYRLHVGHAQAGLGALLLADPGGRHGHHRPEVLEDEGVYFRFPLHFRGKEIHAAWILKSQGFE